MDLLGPEAAFDREIHHLGEHSIELASVWFHYFIGGRPCAAVPVLCGSFEQFVAGDGGQSESLQAMNRALEYLREATAGRRTLVIASGDLAHVGPAFGDVTPVDSVGRAKLAAEDAKSIAAIRDGDASRLLEVSRAESDARRLCGLPPIYMALRLLDGVEGESVGYAQCPADPGGGSLVSIVGALLYKHD